MLFVYAGCGVNALPGLQNRPKSINCGDCVGLFGIAHQPVFHFSAV
ncbi:hypothetical protein HMPREF1608_01583 [Escherichia coli 908525]|nr:hypothetical protein HMPREF9540_00459 [Escherichia coli MS 115-1]ESD75797.1 hypothetical protein HMPREF1608_01583 [Escherichia coli 908525]